MTITTPHLKRIRVEKFLTATELARRSKITKVTVSRLEHGHPTSISTVNKLARALNVEPKDLAVVTEGVPMRESPRRESTALSGQPRDPEDGR